MNEQPASDDMEALLSAKPSSEEEPVAAPDPGLAALVDPPADAPAAAEPEGDEMALDDEFAALLAESLNQADREIGEVVRGNIVRVAEDLVFIDIGAKTEALMETAELRRPDGTLRFSIGDEIEAYVVDIRDGLIKLSETLARVARSREELEDAYRTGTPIQGTVVARNKGGFDVDCGGIRAFLPAGQATLRRGTSTDELIGQTVDLMVSELDPRGRNVVVSRKPLLEAEAEARAQELLSTLAPGMELEGTVSSVREYGAFVDIGGLDGLVHVSEISHQRIRTPADVLSVGAPVKVRILKLDAAKKKISLSIKACSLDPWAAVGTQFVSGGIYQGTVTRLAEFGAFVEIAPGLEGLLHISQITWERHLKHPSEALAVGETVKVAILEVDGKRHRLSLGMKQVDGDPWAGVSGRFPRRSVHNVEVERIEKFGLIVKLAEGVSGVVPNNELGIDRGVDPRRHFPVGSTFTAVVLDVNRRTRRIRLSKKGAKLAEERAEYKKAVKEARKRENRSLGTLGDIFGKIKLSR